MRTAEHAWLVGVLMIVYSTLFFGLGLLLAAVREAGARFPGIVVTGVVVLALVPLAAGIGVLRRRPWGRTTAYVAAVLSLIFFPFGTALGVYALWVLTRPETDAVFAVQSPRPAP
jgi:hypothetical protein